MFVVKRKYPLVIKECPVCDTKFEASIGSPREKQTCSCACANTYFRSGKDHPKWKDISDNKDKACRDICFQCYLKECIICEWNISVDVHHIDYDHNNDDPSNLIPLCANHHRMAHMTQYKEEIIQAITSVPA